jgi:5-methylcytosine-specific restriction endonuclease McrBC GTP-binding regulatory subunit McrB
VNNEFQLFQIDENLKLTDKMLLRKDIDIFSRQKILFGAPGTGKSHKINQLRKEFEVKEFKTVFHPDSDYPSFVGAYKPMMKGDDVRYAFVPQVFTKAYTYAWNNPDELVLLTIEEINRGNCAQIFGDLFQCLDRNASGASEYAIDAEYDLAEYLKENLENQEVMESFFEENYQAEDCFSKIALPQNLLIYATMNTSDQSLFPMDSAFKRRWDWEYVPINYKKANEMTIQLDETTAYNWGDFIKRINEKIYDITQSEDKQLGNYFVKTNDNEPISLDIFRSKVMFYLWSEIFKEENESDTIFKYSENGEYKAFTFNQLYNENTAEILKSFMAYNNIVPS